jgi:hypothetical protein
MSNLLYPGPMQFNNAPPPQPAPMIPQQQLAQQGFAQRFKQNLGPILQAAGMGLASGNWGAAAAAMPGLAERRQEQFAQQQAMAQEQQRLNATAEWAKTQDPEVAMMLEKGMINGSQAVQMIQQKRQAAQPGSQPALIQEYEYAKSQGFEGSIMDYQAGKARIGGGVQSSLTPQWGKDTKTGKWGMGVLQSDGGFKLVDVPEGFELAGPEGVAESRAAGTEQGKVRGGAAANLPQAEFQVQNVQTAVNGIINDPYLPNMTGPVNSMLPNVTGDAARFKSKVEQLKGQAFLGARQALKGGGQITDYEGQRAEAALLRAEMAQNPQDFIAAMQEFQMHMERGLEILRLQAGQGGGSGEWTVEEVQ